MDSSRRVEGQQPQSRCNFLSCTPCCESEEKRLTVKVHADQPVVSVPVYQEIQRRDKYVEMPQVQVKDTVIPKVYTQETVHDVPQIDVKYEQKPFEVSSVSYVDRPVEVPVHMGYAPKFIPKWDVRAVPRPVPKYMGEQKVIKVEVPQVEYVDKVVEKEVVVDINEKVIQKVVEVEKPIEVIQYKWKEQFQDVPVYKYVPKFDVELEMPPPLIVPFNQKMVKETTTTADYFCYPYNEAGPTNCATCCEPICRCLPQKTLKVAAPSHAEYLAQASVLPPHANRSALPSSTMIGQCNPSIIGHLPPPIISQTPTTPQSYYDGSQHHMQQQQQMQQEQQMPQQLMQQQIMEQQIQQQQMIPPHGFPQVMGGDGQMTPVPDNNNKKWCWPFFQDKPSSCCHDSNEVSQREPPADIDPLTGWPRTVPQDFSGWFQTPEGGVPPSDADQNVIYRQATTSAAAELQAINRNQECTEGSNVGGVEYAERMAPTLEPTVEYAGAVSKEPVFGGSLEPISFKLHAIEIHQFIPLPHHDTTPFIQMMPDATMVSSGSLDKVFGPVPSGWADPDITGMPAPMMVDIVKGNLQSQSPLFHQISSAFQGESCGGGTGQSSDGTEAVQGEEANESPPEVNHTQFPLQEPSETPAEIHAEEVAEGGQNEDN